MTTYGLLIFEGAGELGSAGPWGVFTASASIRRQGDRARLRGHQHDLVALSPDAG